MSLDNFNKLGALRAMKNNNIVYGSSHGTCAKSVRLFLESGGINTAGHPVAASGYLTYLPKIGFNAITTISGKKNLADWSKNHALVGDIAVMKHGKYGHICMWDGKQWVSDFKLKNANPYKEDVEITIFRHNGVAPEEKETPSGFNFDWDAFDFSGNGKNQFNPFDYNLWLENGSKTDLPIFSKRGSKLIKKKNKYKINKSGDGEDTSLYLIPNTSIDTDESANDNTDQYYSLALIDRGWVYNPTEKKYTYTLPNGTASTYDPVSHIFSAIDENGLETLYPIIIRGENNTDDHYLATTPIGSFGAAPKDRYTMNDIDQAMKDALLAGEDNLTISTIEGLSEEDKNKIIEAAKKYGLHIKEFRNSVPETGIIASPIETDFAYARDNIPAKVAFPDKYHDPNIMDILLKGMEHTGTITIPQSKYENMSDAVDLMTDIGMGFVGGGVAGALTEGAVAAALRGTGKVLWRGIKPLFNPGGEIVDRFVINAGKGLEELVERWPWLAKNTKYANFTNWVKGLDLGADIMGATTIPGLLTNGLMTAGFAAEATKDLWNRGLNLETGINFTLAAGLPLAGAAMSRMPFMMQAANKVYNRIPWKVKHPFLAYNKAHLADRYREYRAMCAEEEAAARAYYDNLKKELQSISESLEELQKEVRAKLDNILSDMLDKEPQARKEVIERLGSIIKLYRLNSYDQLVRLFTKYGINPEEVKFLSNNTYSIDEAIKKCLYLMESGTTEWRWQLWSEVAKINREVEFLLNSLRGRITNEARPYLSMLDKSTTISLDELELYVNEVAKESGIFGEYTLEMGPNGQILIKKSTSGNKVPFSFTLADNVKVPKFEKGKLMGYETVSVGYKDGYPHIEGSYRETMAGNIAAVESRLPGAKVIGSGKGAANLGVPHYSEDLDVVISEKKARELIPNFDDLPDGMSGYTKKAALDKDGNIVSAKSADAVLKLDINIVETDEKTGMAKGKLAEEIFHQFFPQEYSELCLELYLKDSNVLSVDIPMTADELVGKMDPTLKTLLDAHEIDFWDPSNPKKAKHIGRILNYITLSDDQDAISSFINLLSKLIDPSGLWRPPRFAFDNPEENAALLEKMGMSSDGDIIHNPQKMQNIFDYWILDKLTQRRGIYNAIDRTGYDINEVYKGNDYTIKGVVDPTTGDPIIFKGSPEAARELVWKAFMENLSIGGRGYGEGINTVNGTSAIVGFGRGGRGGSMDIIGTSATKVDWSGVKTPDEAIERALYTTGSSLYSGKWPIDFEGGSPSTLLEITSGWTDALWKEFAEKLRPLKIHALTSDKFYMNNRGNYRSLIDLGGTDPVYNFLHTNIRSIPERILNGGQTKWKADFIRKGIGEFTQSDQIKLSSLRKHPQILEKKLNVSELFPVDMGFVTEEVTPEGTIKLVDPLGKQLTLWKQSGMSNDEIIHMFNTDSKGIEKNILNIDTRNLSKYYPNTPTMKEFKQYVENLHKQEQELSRRMGEMRSRRVDLEIAQYQDKARRTARSDKMNKRLELAMAKLRARKEKAKGAAAVGGVLSSLGLAGAGIAHSISKQEKEGLLNIYNDDLSNRETIKFINSGKYEKLLAKQESELRKALEKEDSAFTRRDLHAIERRKKQVEHYKKTGEWKTIGNFRKGGKLIPHKFKVIK